MGQRLFKRRMKEDPVSDYGVQWFRQG